MRVRPVTPADADAWTRMRAALWPEDTPASHAREVRSFLRGDRRIILAAMVAETAEAPAPSGLGGMIELNERSHADGCTTGPVAFVEGLYVEPACRRRGVARMLLAAAETWARDRGLREIASDCLADNAISLACHRAAGFEVVDQVTNLRKAVADPPRVPTRLDMLGLFVADLPRMVAFYRDVVGLTIGAWQPPYAEFFHHGIRFSMFERAHVPKLLGQTPEFPGAAGRLNGSFELALRVHEPAHVDEEYRRMVAAGAVPVTTPRDEPWGMRSCYVADPEGNLIEIAGPPASEKGVA